MADTNKKPGILYCKRYDASNEGKSKLKGIFNFSLGRVETLLVLIPLV
jgi:hypothetical protein